MNNRKSVFYGFTKYFVSALIISFFPFLHSCKEDTGNLGTNVLPKSDIISAYETDTSTLLTSMYLRDSVQTNGSYPVMLGGYNDPVFGQAKTSIYTLTSSPTVITTIPWENASGIDTATVDSAVLILPYYLANGYFYGNLDPQTVVVDTLENYLSTSTNYYSDTNIKYGPSPIAVKQIIPPNPLINDTFRIKLNPQWTSYAVAKMNGNSAYYYPKFDSLVKGLYITVSNPLQLPGQGGIWYIDLSASFAGIYFYYHGQTPTLTPQTEYNVQFPVGGGGSQYFTHVDKNYATAAFYNAHPSGRFDSINGNEFVYIQAMGGVVGRINFPNLAKNWAKLKPVLINEAEVDMTVDAQDLSTAYPPPLNLYLKGTNSAWQEFALPDEGYPYIYGGGYNAFNHTYSFVITQYIQQVINGRDTDRGLYIYPGNFVNSPNRVVLYGAQHNNVPNSERMNLKIYYTPLKKN